MTVGPWGLGRTADPYHFARSADLSGQVVDNQLAQEWGRRILEEFHLQAEREERAGLPSTVAVSNDLGMTVKAQHFFLTRVSACVLRTVYCTAREFKGSNID